MRRLLLDDKIERVVIDGFTFALGVYPTEPMEPLAGYTEQFEPADGATDTEATNSSEQWEQWPDRFVYDIAISANRLPALCRGLFSLLPGRVFPILDVLGTDAYREIDPYLAYDRVGIEKFLEGLREFGPWLLEDGLVGFGAMSTDPFFYVFIDEHKLITVRTHADLKSRVEKQLAAFDLSAVREIRGADAAEHEHRSVLRLKPVSKVISADEIVERLRDQWVLQLNVDPRTNVDAEGNDLGITGWQCVARCSMEGDESDSYAELLLTADSLEHAERMAEEAISSQAPKQSDWANVEIVRSDRVSPDQFAQWVGKKEVNKKSVCEVHDIRWLAGGPPAQKRSR